jgi:putative lipoprotein (rSAM/lipoprotein system)
MKTYKIKWLKTYNSFIVLMLSSLGFLTSCFQPAPKYGAPPDTISPAKYGTPQAKFILKGKVLSEKNNKSIVHIRVRQDNDTVYTDNDGKFIIEKTTEPYDNQMKIILDDIDGKTNGAFKSLKMDVNFKDVPFVGGTDEWNQGEAIKEIDIKLKPK